MTIYGRLQRAVSHMLQDVHMSFLSEVEEREVLALARPGESRQRGFPHRADPTHICPSPPAVSVLDGVLENE